MNFEDFKLRMVTVNNTRQEELTTEERTALKITGYLAMACMTYTSYRLVRGVAKTVVNHKGV